MKRRQKIYLKLNLTSIFFIVVSSISVTLAWFAYSGLANVKTEVGIKAWYIEFEKNNEKISNDIVISLSDIYPGMETVTEIIDINNLGDSDAELKYSLISARILDDANDNYIVGNGVESTYVEDALSHNYPFHININLSKKYVLAQGDQSVFEVSISWPLDSESNALDSLWGNKAYQFQKDELNKKQLDDNYKTRSSIDIVLSVSAEQSMNASSSEDFNYPMGKEILYDVVNDSLCESVNSTCLKTHIIDVDNKIGNNKVTLLPDITDSYPINTYNNYFMELSNFTSNWKVNVRPLLVDDLLKVVSTDIINSFLVRNNISDVVIGNLNYGNRFNAELAKSINYNGYYKYNNSKFNYLASISCYWTSSEYNSNNAFAVSNIDSISSKIYGSEKSTSCSIVPIIEVLKTNLQT